MVKKVAIGLLLLGIWLIITAPASGHHNGAWLPLVPQTPLMQNIINTGSYTWCVNDTAAGVDGSLTRNIELAGTVPNDQSAESEVADQDIGTESEDKPRDSGGPCSGDSRSEIVGRCGIVQDVGRTANTKGGVRRQRDAGAQSIGRE